MFMGNPVKKGQRQGPDSSVRSGTIVGGDAWKNSYATKIFDSMLVFP